MPGTYVHLYMNGLYWGLFNVHERPDADYQESYLGGDADEYDVLSTQASVVDGDKDRWDQAIALANEGIECEIDGAFQAAFPGVLAMRLLVRTEDMHRARAIIDAQANQSMIARSKPMQIVIRPNRRPRISGGATE